MFEDGECMIGRYLAKLVTAAALLVAGLAISAEHHPALAQEQASEAGLVAFNNSCRTCHTVKEGDNRLGPTLYNIVGRKAGTVEGFAYSPSLKDAGFVWDEEKLDAFIANPEATVPGNNMKPYAGMTDAEERKKIIAYLANPGS